MKRGREEMTGGGSSTASTTSSSSSGSGSGSGSAGAHTAPAASSRRTGKGKGDPPSWLEPVEDGRKRSRRPPPRFETATSSREEMILRQAIENSKIETTLSTAGVDSIPEVPTYRCVGVLTLQRSSCRRVLVFARCPGINGQSINRSV
jgi:hypothetical protein